MGELQKYGPKREKPRWRQVYDRNPFLCLASPPGWATSSGEVSRPHSQRGWPALAPAPLSCRGSSTRSTRCGAIRALDHTIDRNLTGPRWAGGST